MNRIIIIGTVGEKKGAFFKVYSEENIFDCKNTISNIEVAAGDIVEIHGYFRSKDKMLKKTCSNCHDIFKVPVTDSYVIVTDILKVNEDAKQYNQIEIDGIVKKEAKTKFAKKIGIEFQQLRIQCNKDYSYLSINTKKDIQRYKKGDNIYCFGRLKTKQFEKKCNCSHCNSVQMIGQRNSIILNPYIIR